MYGSCSGTLANLTRHGLPVVTPVPHTPLSPKVRMNEIVQLNLAAVELGSGNLRAGM